jgi:multiple sugar transport system ATP-binding protein
MNFVQGQIGDGGFRDATGTVWPVARGPQAQDGRPAVYGIRPEHLHLDPGGLKARVHVIEPTGSETQVMADIGGQPLTAVFRERITAKPGDLIGISPDPSLVHLFDRETGGRLQ